MRTAKNLRILAMILLPGICSALLAQSSSPTAPAPASSTTAAAQKVPERLPGLDPRLIDAGANPCDNFYQYACGNFAKLYTIPNDRPDYWTGPMVQEYTAYVMHGMLERAANGGTTRTANEQKIGDYYAACNDTAAIDRRGLAPLQPDFDRIAALKSVADLAPVLAHFQLVGVNAFLNFEEQQDFKDARKQIAAVDQAGLGLPDRDYYFRPGDAAEKTRKAYVQYIAAMLVLAGSSENQAAKDADEIMKLETSLAKISMDATTRRDPQSVYHMMGINDLVALTPNFAWKPFLADMNAPAVAELNVVNPDFFKGLSALLATTDVDTIKAYLRWQLLQSLTGYILPAPLDDEKFSFNGRQLRGQKQQRERWKRCIQATDAALGEALGQVYVTQEFPSSSKQATLQMVHDIEAAMEKDIDTLEWMTPETKERAKAKLQKVVDKIGYPDHWRDYSALEIVRNDAFTNYIRATVFESQRQIAKIGKPVDRGDWDATPATINAYYNPSMNDINFPAGILQRPLYDAAATDAENYSHIGAIVGHELTHGFDDQGRQFDGDGNLSDWWTDADAKKFEEKTSCEVQEYGNFTAVDDVKVNGKLTLGENTADNGGLRLAYAAFLADAARKGIALDQKQGGYTPIQQFFLGYGQAFCGISRPQQVRLQTQTDPHSPREFRVNGVVENMPEFGHAFSCHVGQPMMPANPCRVW
jgi:putative endopeptidase